MSVSKFSLAVLVILVVSSAGLAQKKNAGSVCSQATFASLKALPELQYDCPEGVNDFSEQILNLPDRVAASNEIVKELESWTDASWWRANIDELNVCELPRAGLPMRKSRRSSGRVIFYSLLFGNHQIRMDSVNGLLLSNRLRRFGFVSAVSRGRQGLRDEALDATTAD